MSIIVIYKNGASARLSELNDHDNVAYYADSNTGKRFIPWDCSNSAKHPPRIDDVDEVLFGDGSFDGSWNYAALFDWKTRDESSRIIGYNYKSDEEVLTETNTEEWAYIKRKTVTEIYKEFQEDVMLNRDDLIDYLKELDIIREETLLEKFEAENDIKVQDSDIELFNMITHWMKNRNAD